VTGSDPEPPAPESRAGAQAGAVEAACIHIEEWFADDPAIAAIGTRARAEHAAMRSLAEAGMEMRAAHAEWMAAVEAVSARKPESIMDGERARQRFEASLPAFDAALAAWRTGG